MEKEQKMAITELADLLHANNLSELEYESNGVYIRVARAVDGGMPTIAVSAPAPVAAQTPVVAEQPKNFIKSPMVGVLYLSKDPATPPFVRVGDTVKEGQTVCLIEAMKTYNPIKAKQSGRIKAVLVENGTPVEYDQPLFEIE